MSKVSIVAPTLATALLNRRATMPWQVIKPGRPKTCKLPVCKLNMTIHFGHLDGSRKQWARPSMTHVRSSDGVWQLECLFEL
jgi:hypothetical protein